MWQRRNPLFLAAIVATALLQVACPEETADPPDRGVCPVLCFLPEVCNTDTGFCEDPSPPADTGQDVSDVADVADGDTADVVEVEDVPDEEAVEVTDVPDLTDSDDGSEGDPDLHVADDGTNEPEVDDGDLADEEVGPSLDYMTCLEPMPIG